MKSCKHSTTKWWWNLLNLITNRPSPSDNSHLVSKKQPMNTINQCQRSLSLICRYFPYLKWRYADRQMDLMLLHHSIKWNQLLKSSYIIISSLCFIQTKETPEWAWMLNLSWQNRSSCALLMFLLQNAGSGSLDLWSRCVESTTVPLSGFAHTCTQEPHRWVFTTIVAVSSFILCGLAASNFLSRVVNLEWIGRQGEHRRHIQNGSKDHSGRLPRTREKFFNITKENMGNPVRKVLSVQGYSRLLSHRGGDSPECLLVMAEAACRELHGSEIPVLCVPSGLVTSMIEPWGVSLCFLARLSRGGEKTFLVCATDIWL